MFNREKVIKGLEYCSIGACGGKECPYYHDVMKDAITGCDCTTELVRDSLSMLKEQEAEWIYGEDETGVDGWRCSECNFFEPWFYDFDDDIDFIKRYEHCPKCGRRMTSYTGKQEGR